MSINFAKRFKKQYNKADSKIKTAFDKRFILFKQNAFHPLLDNHALTGKYSGQRSIDITGDWRAIFRESLENEEKITTFNILGTHSKLYKKSK